MISLRRLKSHTVRTIKLLIAQASVSYMTDNYGIKHRESYDSVNMSIKIILCRWLKIRRFMAPKVPSKGFINNLDSLKWLRISLKHLCWPHNSIRKFSQMLIMFPEKFWELSFRKSIWICFISLWRRMLRNHFTSSFFYFTLCHFDLFSNFKERLAFNTANPKNKKAILLHI